MDTIFMNSDNSKASKHIFQLKLASKLDLWIGEKVIALSNLSIYYTWKNVKSSYNNNKLKISGQTWKEEFTLPDGSYSVSDIQDYFEYIMNYFEYIKSMGKILINCQYRYMWTKLKIG